MCPPRGTPYQGAGGALRASMGERCGYIPRPTILPQAPAAVLSTCNKGPLVSQRALYGLFTFLNQINNALVNLLQLLKVHIDTNQRLSISSRLEVAPIVHTGLGE